MVGGLISAHSNGSSSYKNAMINTFFVAKKEMNADSIMKR